MGEKISISRWLRVLLWGGVITTLSSSCFSFEHTQHLFNWIIGWGPSAQFTSATSTTCVSILRKTAHVLEYAVLTGLLWSAIAPRSPRWSWARAAAVLFLVGCCASADEFRQTHVPNRMGQPVDVAIDASGSVLALSLLFLTARARTREAVTC